MRTAISVSNPLLDPSIHERYVTTQELRVLQVFHGLGMGGAETWLISLLKYFQKQNEDDRVKVKFDVLLTGGEKEVFDDEAAGLGARLFYVPFRRKNIGNFISQFRKMLRHGNYDVIHDHQDYIAGLHFAMGAGLLPPVRIAHVHNPFYHRENPGNTFWARRVNQLGKYFVGRHATHVMGTSRQIVSEYGFDNLSDVVTLGTAHCGFDVEPYCGDYLKKHADLCAEFGWDESAKILLFVGRLEGAEFLCQGNLMTHKNPAFALEVARECVARDDALKLLMVGSGEQKRKEFEKQVNAWGLTRNIRFAGPRADVPQLMIGSDLLLFPSVAEGLGMVVVEAQAAGLPVLASDTTPQECVVVQELVNFLPLKIGPVEWALRVLRLLEGVSGNPFAANDAVFQSNFSITNSANRLLDLYLPSKPNSQFS
jgi:glycosyltransferase involved in cell wall biosynthesis